MVIFSGEVCVFCGRPVVVDDKNPQVARCRKCSAPYHTQCWFAGNEKCTIPGCDGKASDISHPKVKERVGDVCPFLPEVPPKREGEAMGPAKCLRARCMLYDGVEKRCALGEIAYTLAAVRQSGRQTRNLVGQAVGSSSKQTVHLLTALANTARSTEGSIKGLATPQEKANQTLLKVAALLEDVKNSIGALAGDQQAAAEGFDRLANAVEASGVGERVRSLRDARLSARAALRDGRPGASVQVLSQAHKRAPNRAGANDLATALVHAGKKEEAKELLERILAENPDYTPCRITLATLGLDASDPQSAENLLKDAPQPANPLLRAELAYARACTAYAVGRSEDAVDLLNRALDEDPWHADAAAALEDLRARRSGAAPPDAAKLAVSLAGYAAPPEEEAADG